MHNDVDLKPYLKYNDNLIAVLKVLAFPLNWISSMLENWSRQRTTKMVEKWLAE